MAELEIALSVLELSIKVGKQIKEFIKRYRHALESISMVEISFNMAASKIEQFHSALRIIPRRYHESIIEAIEILNPMLEGLAALLTRYDHPDRKIHAVDQAHWAAFGERRAKRIKKELEHWSHNVFELVVVTLLTLDQRIREMPATKNENPVPVSGDVIKSLKEVPGVKAAVRMNEAVTAIHPSISSTQELLKLNDASMEILNPTFSLSRNYDEETSLATMDSYGGVVLEHIYYTTNNAKAINESEIRESTKNLAHILRNSEPEHCYIPTCKGFFKDDHEPRYSLVFSDEVNVSGVNYTVTPYSLKSGISLLKRERASDLTAHERVIINALGDLELRTKMAIQLIHALSYIHAIGWLHKGFQSSKVLLAVDGKGAVFPLVLGFHRSRPFDLQWSLGLEVHEEWSEILYRHPDRWKSAENPKFMKRYDVYALGVVLLELGMGKLAVKVIEQPVHNTLANSDPVRKAQLKHEEANQVVDTFINEARNLKKKQGRLYSENLVACFCETRFLQGDAKGSESDDEEADTDRCRNLLSRWVTDLSGTKF